jgi:energy-converting hydrogenase Eha subunit A
MRLKLAQWTGIAVTAIVVSGSDIDIVYAVPLGFFAGALATFISALAQDRMERPATKPPTG